MIAGLTGVRQLKTDWRSLVPFLGPVDCVRVKVQVEPMVNYITISNGRLLQTLDGVSGTG